MRSVWKGSISFGLVNIPVAVYPATGGEDKIAFKQLRKSDQSLIRYKKVAEVDDKEVPANEIVKGYEFEKGKFVVVDEKDFEAVEIESTHAIEINDFIDVAGVNPKYFYKPYFLEAQKGGDKAYALLHRALTETGKIGIAKVAIRSREYLAAIRPNGLFLMLELMHFAHEVLDPGELKPAAGIDLNPKEIEMAKSLIDSLSSDWEPEKYTDHYQDALKEVIERKIKHLPPAKAGAKPRMTGPVIDLMEVLKQSLAENSDKRNKSAGDPRKKSTAKMVSAKRPKGLKLL